MTSKTSSDMRNECADRIWVGNRGKEATRLSKRADKYDGSMTTIHANGSEAVRRLVDYVTEAGMAESVARKQVSLAFGLDITVSKVQLGRRVITEIAEIVSTENTTAYDVCSMSTTSNPKFRSNRTSNIKTCQQCPGTTSTSMSLMH